MNAQKKVIKADSLKELGISVEKVEYGGVKFNARVFKDVKMNDRAVELGGEEIEYEEALAAPQTPPDQELKPQIEQFHDAEGNLTGLKITCRCGEVIELEFSGE